MSRNRTKNKQVQYKTLLSVLANGSELESRDLLKKYSGQDAQNTKDLEAKLARVYALSTDKREIEKQFALIHPHKEFILKYIKPKEELQALQPDTSITEDTDVKEAEKLTNTVIHDGYSNANGYDCSKSSNACGCNSSFNGYSNMIGDTQSSALTSNNHAIMVVGIVSIVALVGMVLYLHKNKK